MNTSVTLLGVCALLGRADASAWNFSRPLRICTASIQSFGAQCDVPGLAPSDCPGRSKFCGFDIDIWTAIVDKVGLVAGHDFEHVCMGRSGFDSILASLGDDKASGCDIGVSAITVTVEREDMGISFSRPIYQSYLSALVYTPPRDYGAWAFMRPLHRDVWLALGATMLVTPVLIVFVEAVFSDRSEYVRTSGGRILVVDSLVDAAWDSLSQVLLLDTVNASSFPARIILMGFGFLVLTVTNTYTASLFSVLTTHFPAPCLTPLQIQQGRIGTTEAYSGRLRGRYDVVLDSDITGYGYDALVHSVENGTLTAVVGDFPQLNAHAAADATCSLDVVKLRTLPYDIAFAYRYEFPHRDLVARIDLAILHLQQNGVLSSTQRRHSSPPRGCQKVYRSDTVQVQLDRLRGVWVLVAVGCMLSVVVGTTTFARATISDHPSADGIVRRARVFAGTDAPASGSAHGARADVPAVVPGAIRRSADIQDIRALAESINDSLQSCTLNALKQ